MYLVEGKSDKNETEIFHKKCLTCIWGKKNAKKMSKNWTVKDFDVGLLQKS